MAQNFYNKYVNLLNSLNGTTPMAEQIAAAQSVNLPQQTANIAKNTKAINTAKAIRGGVKTGLEFTPYAGDVIDIGQGLYEATHGHPFAGTGQAILGGGGLAANVLYPGAGTLAKTGVKAGVKNIAKALAYLSPKVAKGIKGYAKFNRGAVGQGLTMGLPNIVYGINGNIFDNNSDNNNGNNNNGNNKSTTKKGGNGVSARTVQPSQQAVAANVANELANEENTQSNMDAINKYIEQLQAINQPYIQGLTNYYNNYNKLLDQAQRGAGYWQGIAALTGDKNWANMANYYNNLTNEANRLSALKQIQDAKAADMNAITEALGNMEIARQLDISPEAAFANKNLLTALTANRRNLTDWEKAQLAAELKRYGIDVGYNKAIDVQKLRNQSSLGVANIYAGMGGVAPGLTAQGTIPMMYNNTQVPIQQPQSQEASVYSQIRSNR